MLQLSLGHYFLIILLAVDCDTVKLKMFYAFGIPYKLSRFPESSFQGLKL